MDCQKTRRCRTTTPSAPPHPDGKTLVRLWYTSAYAAVKKRFPRLREVLGDHDPRLGAGHANPHPPERWIKHVLQMRRARHKRRVPFVYSLDHRHVFTDPPPRVEEPCQPVSYRPAAQRS